MKAFVCWCTNKPLTNSCLESTGQAAGHVCLNVVELQYRFDVSPPHHHSGSLGAAATGAASRLLPPEPLSQSVAPALPTSPTQCVGTGCGL